MTVEANQPFARYAASRRVHLLTMLAEGHTVAAIARRLHTSDRTVRRTVRRLCDQTGCRSTAHLVAWAVTVKLITPAVPSVKTASPTGCCGPLADGCHAGHDSLDVEEAR